MKKNNLLRAKIIERFGVYADFAEHIREDESIISRIVCGRRDLTQDKKAAWAHALNCKPEDIFKD